MKDNVIPINTSTTLDIDPDKVLAGAHGMLEECIVIGWDKDKEFYIASSAGQASKILWLLESAKKQLME